MNSQTLFEAIGEVDAEKVLRCEQPAKPRSHRKLRLIGLLAAAVAVLASMALLAGAETKSRPKDDELRVWINGRTAGAEDPRAAVASEADGYTVEVDFDESDTSPEGYYNREAFSAVTGKTGEMVHAYYSARNERGVSLNVRIMKNQVIEEDGRIVLRYDGHNIDLTEQLQRSDQCEVEYVYEWVNGDETRVVICVDRAEDGEYRIYTEPG